MSTFFKPWSLSIYLIFILIYLLEYGMEEKIIVFKYYKSFEKWLWNLELLRSRLSKLVSKFSNIK